MWRICAFFLLDFDAAPQTQSPKHWSTLEFLSFADRSNDGKTNRVVFLRSITTHIPTAHRYECRNTREPLPLLISVPSLDPNHRRRSQSTQDANTFHTSLLWCSCLSTQTTSSRHLHECRKSKKRMAFTPTSASTHAALCHGDESHNWEPYSNKTALCFTSCEIKQRCDMCLPSKSRLVERPSLSSGSRRNQRIALSLA